MVTADDVRAAAGRIATFVRRTPVWPSLALSEVAGAEVLLKLENLQRTGSFKLRGASNMLAAAGPVAGVVAASAGNHAQGVGLAARQRALPVTIVMPAAAPLAKQSATRGYGAEIVLVDGSLSAAQERARAIAAERGLLYVPPYDAAPIVAGQGTVGLEILAQTPEVETVIVPAGGGGLLAGVAVAVKAARPQTRIVGVQTAAMPGIADSLAAGAPRAVPARRTIADGVAVAGPSTLTFELIRRHVDAVVTVTEEEIARAVVFLIERSRVVAEGAGALGVAALRGRHIRPTGRTVVVLSGGNIDINVLGRLAERGLLADGRQRRVTIAAANVPGELALITRVVAEAGANVIEVTHELATPDLPVGVARVALRIERAGPEAYRTLETTLIDAGFLRGVATDFQTAAAAARAE